MLLIVFFALQTPDISFLFQFLIISSFLYLLTPISVLFDLELKKFMEILELEGKGVQSAGKVQLAFEV